MNQETIFRESHLRSVLKACTWRVVATCTTFTIAYVVTGKTSVAVTIAGVEVVTKIAVYYFHERAWNLIPRGMMRKLRKRK